MGLIGILVALALLIWFAYRGWSVLLVAPVAALAAALLAGEPVLPHWTQTFMPGAARFVACLLYTSPSPRDQRGSRMPSSA